MWAKAAAAKEEREAKAAAAKHVIKKGPHAQGADRAIDIAQLASWLGCHPRPNHRW